MFGRARRRRRQRKSESKVPVGVCERKAEKEEHVVLNSTLQERRTHERAASDTQLCPARYELVEPKDLTSMYTQTYVYMRGLRRIGSSRCS